RATPRACPTCTSRSVPPPAPRIATGTCGAPWIRWPSSWAATIRSGSIRPNASSSPCRSSADRGARTRAGEPALDRFRALETAGLLAHVETEVADLAVLHRVVLALEPEPPPLPGGGHGSVGGEQIVVAHHLGADEPARDVGVDGPRRVLGAGGARDRPRPYLVLAHREERDEAEQRVAVLEHAPDRRLGEAQAGEERGLPGPRELRHLRLDHRGDPAEAGGRPLRHRLQSEALGEGGPARDLLLGQVEAVKDRFLGEKGESAEGARLVVGEAHRPDRPLGLEQRLHLLEH